MENFGHFQTADSSRFTKDIEIRFLGKTIWNLVDVRFFGQKHLKTTITSLIILTYTVSDLLFSFLKSLMRVQKMYCFSIVAKLFLVSKGLIQQCTLC